MVEAALMKSLSPLIFLLLVLLPSRLLETVDDDDMISAASHSCHHVVCGVARRRHTTLVPADWERSAFISKRASAERAHVLFILGTRRRGALSFTVHGACVSLYGTPCHISPLKSHPVAFRHKHFTSETSDGGWKFGSRSLSTVAWLRT